MKITLPGNPIPNQRPRSMLRGKHIVVYDAQADQKQMVKSLLRSVLRAHLDSDDKEMVMEASSLASASAYSVELWFYLPISNSETIAQRNAKLWGLTQAVNKPDYDNLEKFYLDCASGILWDDDRMIVDARAHKRYSTNPRVEMIIMPKKQFKLRSNEEIVLKAFSPGDVREIANDVQKFKEMAEVSEGEDSSNQFRATACILIDFATKWSDKLRKISKPSVLQMG